jgi:hypothetical protein
MCAPSDVRARGHSLTVSSHFPHRPNIGVATCATGADALVPKRDGIELALRARRPTTPCGGCVRRRRLARSARQPLANRSARRWSRAAKIACRRFVISDVAVPKCAPQISGRSALLLGVSSAAIRRGRPGNPSPTRYSWDVPKEIGDGMARAHHEMPLQPERSVRLPLRRIFSTYVFASAAIPR